MLCPDDGSELVRAEDGVSTCLRCRGRAVTRQALSTAHEHLAHVLRIDEDGEGGAYAHVRPCPQCRRVMLPLKIGEQAAWLESCQSCGIVWMEKLDEAVIERLERRRALTLAVETMPPEVRREMARDIAHELSAEHRQVRLLEKIKDLFRALTGT